MDTRLLARLAAAVVAWLKTLPPSGQEFTAPDLHDSLAAFIARRATLRHGVLLPLPGGLSRVLADISPRLAAAGWSVGVRRTKSARLVVFAPLAAAEGPPVAPGSRQSANHGAR